MTPQRMGQQARGWRGVPDRHLLDTQETQTLHPGKLHVHTHAVFGQARSCQSYSGLAAEGITGFRPLRRTS